MQDPRALANLDNLNSYRAWNREGFQRWMFFPIMMMVMGLPLLTGVLVPFEHNARQFVAVAGTAFALYLVVGLGWLFFAIRRLNAWKRAHPWAPPSTRSS